MPVLSFESSLSPQDNRGPTILKFMRILAAIAMIIVSAMFYLRHTRLHRIKIEDWLMLASLVCAVASTSLNTVAVSRGFGRHKQFLDSYQIAEATKWSYLAQPMGILAAALGRLSVAYLLISILPHQRKARRIFLYGVGYSHLLFMVGMVIFIYAQCHPINAYWNRSLGTCLDPNRRKYFGYFLGSYCSFIDLTLALFPISIFWNLQLRLALKVFLCIIMGLGVIAMAASIVKTVELGVLSHTSDSTYTNDGTSNLLIWYALEMYLVIIAASIPKLKPVALAPSRLASPRGTDCGFSWRRLFMSKSSTDRSHTEDECKLSNQPHNLPASKIPRDIYMTTVVCEDNRLMGVAMPKNKMGLEGNHRTTKTTVGYADKFSMGEQSQVKAQREFEII